MLPAHSMAQMTARPEEFWEDLLAFIEEGRVIPVVGPELLTIAVGGREKPLYRALAEQLLRTNGLEPVDPNSSAERADNQVPLREDLELNDAVIGLLRRGLRVVDLYRPINDELRRLLGSQPAIPQALTDLASIPDFRLFVSTTIDDLLARALSAVRRPTAPPVERIVYAPNLAGELATDLPPERPTNYRAVFQLFGRASSSPFFYAIDEEDILETVYCLQAEKGARPERMLAELRRSHLLLIGCNFADWLSRFFIRLANQNRLSLDRTKKEFLVGDDLANDKSLTLFLERFSHNTRVYPVDAKGFVAELLRRWRERHPETIEPSDASRLDLPAVGASGGVFVSYAHEDIDAAKALCSDLAEIGAITVWFDKSRLTPGDEWDRKIEAAVNSCDIFLPVLSANTEARTEGYFRTEWRLAEKRTERIQGRKFVIPSVVDEQFDPEGFKLFPPGFRAFQFGHAPGGRMNEDLRKVVVEALREVRRRRPD
jgi:hypothetical protein